MSFDFIKNWIFNNELKKTITVPNISSQLVGIYINYTSKEELSKVEDLLMRSGIKRESIKFLSFAKQDELADKNGKAYTLKDIKWAGYPESADIEEFLKSRYHKFYYLASSYEPHQRFILSKVKSDFKAGVHHKGIEQYLDFMVDAPFENIAKSLKVINQTLEKITAKNIKS